MAGVWNEMILKIPSNKNHSRLLWWEGQNSPTSAPFGVSHPGMIRTTLGCHWGTSEEQTGNVAIFLEFPNSWNMEKPILALCRQADPLGTAGAGTWWQCEEKWEHQAGGTCRFLLCKVPPVLKVFPVTTGAPPIPKTTCKSGCKIQIAVEMEVQTGIILRREMKLPSPLLLFHICLAFPREYNPLLPWDPIKSLNKN